MLFCNIAFLLFDKTAPTSWKRKSADRRHISSRLTTSPKRIMEKSTLKRKPHIRLVLITRFLLRGGDSEEK